MEYYKISEMRRITVIAENGDSCEIDLYKKWCKFQKKHGNFSCKKINSLPILKTRKVLIGESIIFLPIYSFKDVIFFETKKGIFINSKDVKSNASLRKLIDVTLSLQRKA